MSVSITINHEQDLKADSTVDVTMTVTEAIEIDDAIIILAVSDDSFQRVAMAWDMINLFNSKTGAIAAEMSVYRSNTGMKTYLTIEGATEFVADNKDRTTYLAEQWASYTDDYEEEDITTHTE